MGPFRYFKKLIELIFLAHENLRIPLMEDLLECHHQSRPRSLLMCPLTFSFRRKLTNYCSIQFQKDFSLCFQDSFSRFRLKLDQVLMKSSFAHQSKVQGFQKPKVQESFSSEQEHQIQILFLKERLFVQPVPLKIVVLSPLVFDLCCQDQSHFLSSQQLKELAPSHFDSRS